MNEFDFLKKQLNDWIGHVLKVVTLTDGERIKLNTLKSRVNPLLIR